LWMDQSALQAAFKMEGAFNDVAIALSQGAQVRKVLAEVDQLLSRFGGVGAVSREKQGSAFMLDGELAQLDSMAGFVPYLFLSVAALLVNVVLSRLVQLQRGIIATVKAVGYPDSGIALHYLKLVSVIVLAGAIIGVGLGVWAGRAMMELYTGEFFRFADPKYTLKPSAILFSVGVSFGVAVLGAFMSVRSVAKMPPAEAMQPPAPAKYRRTLLERLGFFRVLGPNLRMIAREVSRRPLRLFLSA